MEDKDVGFGIKIDKFLRDRKTPLARFVNKVSPKVGQEYRESLHKQVAEFVIASPMAIATLPITAILATAKKLEDGESAFYVQKRVGSKGETIPLIKIRCMRKDADSDVQTNLTEALKTGTHGDPRNTKLGAFMRKFNLEELPQLWQVITGKLSLIEVRAAPQYVIDYLEKERPGTVAEWEKAYKGSRKPGLFSLNSALNSDSKDDKKRHHYDLFYSRKASLGLDLYILYRSTAKAIGKFKTKIR